MIAQKYIQVNADKASMMNNSWNKSEKFSVWSDDKTNAASIADGILEQSGAPSADDAWRKFELMMQKSGARASTTSRQPVEGCVRRRYN
jgi:hypothetical protein